MADLVTIEGLDELIEAFAKLGDEAMPRLKKASDEAGEIVLTKTRQKVAAMKHPTGNLEKSLRLQKKALKSGDTVTYSRVTFGKDAAYAVPLELGHNIRNDKKGKVLGRVEARPFMRPAADESEEEVRSIIIAAMNAALEEMGGKK